MQELFITRWDRSQRSSSALALVVAFVTLARGTAFFKLGVRNVDAGKATALIVTG